MDYVNAKSIVGLQTVLSEEMEASAVKAASAAPDHVVVTDSLELLHGKELVEEALKSGTTLLPVRRVSPPGSKKDFPNRVLLELTSRCNSYCSMCPRNILTRAEMDMDKEVAKSVIAQLAEVGISGLWLYYIGESLLHPDFFEILEYCGQFDTLGTIWLSTNGELVDEDIARRLMDSPVDILNYSVNAMTEKSFAQVTKNLHFQKVQDNYKLLARIKDEVGARKPLLRAQMMELPYVLDEVEDFKREFGPISDFLSINKLELFTQEIEETVKKEDVRFNRRIEKCNRLERKDFFVFSDGSVSCCDTDFNCSFQLGNVNEQSMREIYNGEPYRALMKAYREGRLHERAVCARCHDFHL